jgi:hypothetical protein
MLLAAVGSAVLQVLAPHSSNSITHNMLCDRLLTVAAALQLNQTLTHLYRRQDG